MVDTGSPGLDSDEPPAALFELTYDMEPPPVPENIVGVGGEEAIVLSWDIPESRGEDIRDIQILCARVDGEPIEGPPASGPRYLTAMAACGADDGTHPVSTTGETEQGDLPDDLYNLEESAICGNAAGTDTSVRVEGLENDVAYRLVVVSVDESRNASAVDIGEFMPAPVEDAWENYKNNGGNADGGYCFVATATFGNYDHPFVRVLRDFRDNTLAHYGWGRSFITWYYAKQPRACRGHRTEPHPSGAFFGRLGAPGRSRRFLGVRPLLAQDPKSRSSVPGPPPPAKESKDAPEKGRPTHRCGHGAPARWDEQCGLCTALLGRIQRWGE